MFLNFFISERWQGRSKFVLKIKLAFCNLQIFNTIIGASCKTFSSAKLTLAEVLHLPDDSLTHDTSRVFTDGKFLKFSRILWLNLDFPLTEPRRISSNKAKCPIVAMILILIDDIERYDRLYDLQTDWWPASSRVVSATKDQVTS